MDTVTDSAWVLSKILGHVVFPVWLMAGFADWLLHRRQHIERTAGWKEAALHLLMLAELGVGIGAVLLFRVDALILSIAFAACVAHEVTVWIDLRYASARRPIPIVEQWVHGLQTVIPWAALGVAAALHPTAVVQLLRHPGDPANWRLVFDPALSPAQLAGLALTAGVLVGLPFVEEFWRCASVRRRRA